MRNFEDLPNSYNYNLSGDIDLLVEDLDLAIIISGAKRTSFIQSRVQFNILINGEKILFDLRHVGDDYMCIKWQRDILESRVINSKGIYIPEEKHHFFSLLYHNFIHKKELQKKNLLVLLRCYQNIIDPYATYINFERCIKALGEFMKDRSYSFARPKDKTVLFDTRYILENLNYKNALSKLLITNVRPYLTSHYKNTLNNTILLGEKDGDTLFIKYGSIDFALENEYKISKLLSEINPQNFLKPRFFINKNGEKLFITDFIEGDLLKVKNSSYTTLEREKIIHQLYSILLSLDQAKIVHRDIRPENLIITKDFRIILIDMQLAVSLDGKFGEHKSLIRDAKVKNIFSHLGGEYRLNKKLSRDDAYSTFKIAKLIADCDNCVNQEFLLKIEKMIGRNVYKYKENTKNKLVRTCKRIAQSFSKKASRIKSIFHYYADIGS